MTKHPSIQKLLATLLTIVAVFAGQQAFATITSPMSLTGNSALMNGQYYHVWKTEGFLGYFAQPRTQGSSYTFNGQNIVLQGGDVRITGTLNFTESNDFTDVTTGSTVTVEFYSTNFWFYTATVKKLDGTSVSGCSYSASSDHSSITVTIPSGKTFGNIYLDFVAYEPFYNYNTTISGVEAEYIYTGRPIEPVPTVTYNGTVLTAGTDYTVSYSNTTGPGSASVTVTGTGQYAGTVTRNYNIRAVALTDFTSLGNNTYAIATTADLDHLAGYVNLGNECQGLTFKQTANITFTHSDDWDNSSSTENNYTAIGTEGNPFQGTYDGQNHTISGIRIYKGGTSNSDKRQGIFGAVSTDGTVKRVNLADARITGCDEVGGIVGMTFMATIEDCTVGADVCIHAVKSSTYSHGGIVGFNESAVRRCISRATLTVKNGLTGCNRYGGIVGFNNNSGTVTDCIAVGAVIPDVEGRGAIVGYNNYNSTLIRNYYRDCKVASNNVTPSGVGMGTSQSGTTTSDVDGAQPLFALTLGTNVTLERTAEATLPGTNNKTYANGADIAGVHYAYPTATVTLGYSGTVPAGQTPLYSVDGTAIWGNTFTMPTADCTVSVEIVDGWSGSGTQSDPYVITTTSHLNLLAEMVKNGVNYSGTYFVLGNDIAYSTAGLGDTDENFTTIGGYFNGGDKNFSGTFDGQGHTISGIRLYKTGNSNPSKNQGLFGRISGATIKNVILTDARITGYRYVGGIVGNKASGTVQNCLVLESTITCENTYVGALFGGNSGTITANHYHGCTVNGTANATNVGVGGNGGTSSSSDKNGARSAHILTLGENVTATGESVTYQGTTYYASTTTVTLGYDNLPAGYTVTYTLNGTALTGNTFTMPANDNATVDASTALITYNITYDLDGGSVATANPTTYNVTTPTFTLNNPTKAGYTFTGWTGSNGTTPQTEVTIAQGSTGNLNYTAHWSLDTYNITYDLDGGSVATANPTTYNVTTPTFTLTNPTKVACNFDGWTGTDLTEPTMTVTIAQGSTGDRDYTAHWTQYAFTLTLGTDITASGTVAFTYEGTDYYAVGTEITLAYSGTIPEGQHLVFYVNGTPIANNGNTFAMPAANAEVGVEIQARYTFNSTTGELALIWGEFNKDNKWGSEVTESAVTSVTATDEVSFTGDCFNLFYYFTHCTSMDLNNVNTDNLTNIRCMFWGCQSLTTLNLSSWNTAAVTEMTSAFRNCTGLTSLNLSGWNTANVTNMSNMFLDCSSLQSLDLSGWNTANVTDMSFMFYGCSGLQSLNVSGWNTANVTNMSGMFEGCSGLQSLDLSGWNTANVTNMYYMFDGCSGLQSLNVSGWNTANVTQMSSMFQQCSSLQSLDLTGWSTSNVENMSYMFRGCSGLQSLDLTGWNTSNVEDMSYMFDGCSSLQSLDLTGWNTAKVTDMSFMFYGCTHLATIYVGEGWSTSRVNWSNDMFLGCTSLVGGMGTHYILFHTDKRYARIDRGLERPGYFTAPFTKEIAGYEDNESGWYLIASPLAADIAPTAVTNMTNETFDLYYFDQTGGTNGKEWKNWKNEGGDGYHFNLEAGKGYLYANSGDVTLMFAGTPYDGDGVVNLTYSTDNPNATMHGWNLIGNPFSTNATIGDTPFYRMNAAGSEIIAADVNDNTVNPMEGIFVKATQANQTVTFETAMTRGNANSNSAALVMDISQNRGSVIDRAIVRFGEGQTLPKFQIHENSTKIYIPQDGTDYAVAVIASDSEAIQPTEHPIHFKAAENGTYTLTVSTTFNSQLSTVNYLHLIDNMTGADVDLLASDGGDARPCVSTYTFTAKTTDYASRFKLMFSINQEDGPSTGSGTFAFISNGNLIVNGEGMLQIMDVTGRMIRCTDVARNVSTSGMVPGVYVLRLINGNDVKVQKMVVE